MYLKKLGLITIAFLWAFNLTAAEEKVLPEQGQQGQAGRQGDNQS